MKNRIGYWASVFILLNVSMSVAQDLDTPHIPKGVILPVPKIVRSQMRTSMVTSIQIFEEDFETGGAGWSLTGSWEIGTPTTGPNSGHNSTNVAATDLDNNYTNNANDWLISPTISLPSLSRSDEELKLYFWEWFELESCCDQMSVNVSTDNGSSWTELSSITGSSGDWVETMHDLTVYAGQSVKLGFNLTTDGSVIFDGWYIDDIRVELEGPQPLEAACVSLNHQIFPFIFLNVVVDTFRTGISSLTSNNFQVFENNVLQTELFNVVPPQAGGGTRVADIIFIMDNSGSMAGEQAAVRNNVIDFVNNLSALGVDFALGLTRYGGESGGIPIFEDNGVLTTDPVYFKDDVWLRNVAAGGTEPGYLAMVQSASNFSFRPGTQKIFIIITDETPDQGGATQAEAISVLQDGSITLFALTLVGLSTEFEPVTDATNGRVFDIFSNFDEILNFIVAQVANTYVVSYSSSDPAKNGIERLVEVVVSYNSNQASCSSGSYIPGSAPNIQRTLTTLNFHNQTWTVGTSFTIEVEITDEASPLVQDATLFYKNTTDTSFNSVSMTNTAGDLWEASIPSGFAQAPGVDYYITATDSVSSVSDPSSDPISNPYQIAILPNVAPQITHTPVTEITPGFAILITAEIIDITDFLSETKLRYRNQGHLIYQEADMINTSGDLYQVEIPDSSVTRDGLEYFIKATDNLGVSSLHGTPDKPHRIGGIEGHAVKFGDDVIYGAAGDTILIPIRIDDPSGAGIISAEFDLRYDSTVVSAISVDDTGTLVGDAGWSIVDTVKAGHLKVAMAGTTPLGSGGTLINIVLYVNDSDTIGASSPLQFTSFLFNEGTPAVTTVDGSVTVRSIYGDVSEDGFVHAFDAALILAYMANDTAVLKDSIGDTTLSETRKVVAEVSGDSTITELDASLILQHVVGIIDSFPVEGGPPAPLASGDLSIPDVVPFPAGNENVAIPISLMNGSNVFSGRFLVKYNTESLEFLEFHTTEATGGFTTAMKLIEGEIEIFIAGDTEVTGSEPIVEVIFTRADGGSYTEVILVSAGLNENLYWSGVDTTVVDFLTGVSNESGVPRQYTLSQNYPNPFNPVTVIRYSIPKAEEVSLVVYNLIGEEVAHLIDERKPAGSYTVKWNASIVSSGIYFYRLQAGDFVQTRKMVLLK